MVGGVRRTKLGSQGLEVSAQGLGCMGMSAFYGPPKPEEDMIALIHYAVDSGVTFLDTSAIYGPHANEILLGKLGELKKLVEEGKIKYSGLPQPSEGPTPCSSNGPCGLETSGKILSPLAGKVQCVEELGIGIVAYSPLGRGFLSYGPSMIQDWAEGDYRTVGLVHIIVYTTYVAMLQLAKFCFFITMYNHSQGSSLRTWSTTKKYSSERPRWRLVAWVHCQGDDCWNTDFPGNFPVASGHRICRINGALASSPRALEHRVFIRANRVPGE
ncbi:hypothetical protein V2J09_024061 [Rumex salicifolius]